MYDNSLQFTWQLVKNTFLKNERTVWRKILEMVLALALERTMSKQRILSSYVCKVRSYVSFTLMIDALPNVYACASFFPIVFIEWIVILQIHYRGMSNEWMKEAKQ